MNSLRVLVGGPCRRVVPRGLRGGSRGFGHGPGEKPLSRYAQRLSEDFDLSGLRRDALIQVLEQDQRDRAAVRRKYELASRDAMEPDLRELDEKLEDTIRNTILPPAERERYDQFRRPIELTAAR